MALGNLGLGGLLGAAGQSNSSLSSQLNQHYQQLQNALGQAQAAQSLPDAYSLQRDYIAKDPMMKQLRAAQAEIINELNAREAQLAKEWIEAVKDLSPGR